jgi:hypothetical protein
MIPSPDDELVLARVRARARSAWSASLREDDLTRRAASEARLAATWPRPRVLPARSVAVGAAVAACLALAGFAALRSGPPSPRDEASASLPVAPTRPSARADTTHDASLATSTGVVITGACPACRVDRDAAEPGLRLGAGRALSVPLGSRITLGFALNGALVDPASGIDVEGPAAATVQDPQTIDLERGSARFRGLRDVTVTFPGGHVVSTGATFTVTVDAGGVSRIAVEKADVVVTRGATGATQTVEAGAATEVSAPPARDEGPSAAPPRPSTAAASGARATRTDDEPDEVAKARRRFHDGELAAARAQLTALTASRDAGVARRASFTLAEIEMASGDRADRDSGRRRLSALVTCPDVKLGSDAATVLARSEPTPAARADTWSRYLATSPPPPYRHRALLERAEALFDANRRSEGDAILAELRGVTLTQAQQRHLERLTFKARELR